MQIKETGKQGEGVAVYLLLMQVHIGDKPALFFLAVFYIYMETDCKQTRCLHGRI